MTIACPTPQWPAGLLKAGPAQDPSILLRSVAEIGGAAYTVIAIRINPITMQPDLRNDLPTRIYREHGLTETFEALSALAEISDRSLVQLATGAYAMLMVPTDRD